MILQAARIAAVEIISITASPALRAHTPLTQLNRSRQILLCSEEIYEDYSLKSLTLGYELLFGFLKC